MTDKVNGNARAGEFLTGNMDFFSVATIVPVAQTNVDTPVVDLPGYQTFATLGTWTDVTVVDGAGDAQTYTSLNDYLNAFYKQANMDILLRTFALRANPVVVSVKVLPSSINGSTINAHTSSYFEEAGYNNLLDDNVFGSAYTTGKTITIINLASEKASLWTDGGNNTNVGGYNLMTGLNGVSCFDTQGSQVLADSGTDSNSVWASKNTVSPYVSTWDLDNATNLNTMLVQGAYQAGTLLV